MKIIKIKQINYKKELALLLVIDIILLFSIFSLYVIGAYIDKILIVSIITLFFINFTFFYLRLRFLYKYLLLLFLLLSLFDIFQLSFIHIYIENKIINIELISLIMLIWFCKIYCNFLTTNNFKEKDVKLEKSFFKEKFQHLSKKEIMIKLSNKQYLTNEAIMALEELLNEKK